MTVQYTAWSVAMHMSLASLHTALYLHVADGLYVLMTVMAIAYGGMGHAYYCVLLHTTAQYCIPLRTTAYYCTPLCTSAHYSILLHTTAYYCIPLHTTALPRITACYCTLPHTTAYYCILLHTWGLQEPGSDPASIAASRAAQTGQGGGWMDTILNLIPGRKQKATDEPNEDAIKRTHDYLRSGLPLSDSHMQCHLSQGHIQRSAPARQSNLPHV